MRRVFLAVCIVLAATPAAAEWLLLAPPVDHDLLNVILQGRRTPEGSEPSLLEWRALEVLEAMAAAPSQQARSVRFTKGVMRTDAPPGAWFVLATAKSEDECAEIRLALTNDPFWQGSEAITDLMKARAALGRCVRR